MADNTEELENERGISRRQSLKGAAGLLAAGAATSLGLGLGSTGTVSAALQSGGAPVIGAQPDVHG